MAIAFIGQHRIGKTDLAEKLRAHLGYSRLDCAAEIEEKLNARNRPKNYQQVINDRQEMNGWPTNPTDFRYHEAAKALTQCHAAVMRGVLSTISFKPGGDSGYIIDTVDSLPELPDDIIGPFRAYARVVYLEAPKQNEATIVLPQTPIDWGNRYVSHAGELLPDTFRRCYLDLLKHRAEIYKDIAHVTIAYAEHRHQAITPERLLDRLYK